MVFQALRNRRLMKVVLIGVVVAFTASLLVIGGNMFIGGGSRTRRVIAKVNWLSLSAKDFD